MTKEGDWGMIHSAAKCMALFFHLMREQGKKNRTVTADWMKRWGLEEQTRNPIHREDPNHAGKPT
jgi:hypothetical protein